MHIQLVYALFIALFCELCGAGGGGGHDKVHIKIHVPKLITHKHHTKVVFIHKKDKGHGGGHGGSHGGHSGGHGHGQKKKKQIFIHKHEHKHAHAHKHAHKHDHKLKHIPKHKHVHIHKKHHEKKAHHDTWHGYGKKPKPEKKPKHGKKHVHGKKQTLSHYYDDSDKYPENYQDFVNQNEPYTFNEDIEQNTDDDDDGFGKVHEKIHSERLEVETLKNPYQAPIRQYIVKNSYAVQEKNPYDYTTKEYQENYRYPPLDNTYNSYPTADIKYGTPYGSNNLEEGDSNEALQDEQADQEDDHEDIQDYDYTSDIKEPYKTIQDYANYDYSESNIHPILVKPAKSNNQKQENGYHRGGTNDGYRY